MPRTKFVVNDEETPEAVKPERKGGRGRRRKSTAGKDSAHMFLLPIPNDLFQKVKTLSSLHGWSVRSKLIELMTTYVESEMRKDDNFRQLFEK